MAARLTVSLKGFMKVPKRLQPLVDDGMVDEVLYQLMSGKEAQVYVVRCGDQTRCAKVFKEASKRSFKQAVKYQEGRKVRLGRDLHAVARRHQPAEHVLEIRRVGRGSPLRIDVG